MVVLLPAEHTAGVVALAESDDRGGQAVVVLAGDVDVGHRRVLATILCPFTYWVTCSIGHRNLLSRFWFKLTNVEFASAGKSLPNPNSCQIEASKMENDKNLGHSTTVGAGESGRPVWQPVRGSGKGQTAKVCLNQAANVVISPLAVQRFETFRRKSIVPISLFDFDGFYRARPGPQNA